jgi:hypothetical protein
MDTYNALTSMAPDYAELHNNLAIGYWPGQRPACLESFTLPGAARPPPPDYFQQTLRMNRWSPSRGARC